MFTVILAVTAIAYDSKFVRLFFQPNGPPWFLVNGNHICLPRAGSQADLLQRVGIGSTIHFEVTEPVEGCEYGAILSSYYYVNNPSGPGMKKVELTIESDSMMRK